jgi:hypothetical protein
MIEVDGYDQNLVIISNENLSQTQPLPDQSVKKNRGVIGYTNPEGTIQNVEILKNASTYIAVESSKHGWHVQTIPFSQKIARFVLIRDPYERYISGLIEDLDRYITFNTEKRIFFEKLIEIKQFDNFLDFLFDKNLFEIEGHTSLQSICLSDVILKVKSENLTFIKIHDNLGDTLNLFFQGENCNYNFSNIKLHTRDSSHFLYVAINNYFFDSKNRKRKDKVLTYLQPDYDFINSINFWNRR